MSPHALLLVLSNARPLRAPGLKFFASLGGGGSWTPGTGGDRWGCGLLLMLGTVRRPGVAIPGCGGWGEGGGRGDGGLQRMKRFFEGRGEIHSDATPPERPETVVSRSPKAYPRYWRGECVRAARNSFPKDPRPLPAALRLRAGIPGQRNDVPPSLPRTSRNLEGLCRRGPGLPLGPLPWLGARVQLIARALSSPLGAAAWPRGMQTVVVDTRQLRPCIAGVFSTST